MTEDIDDGVRRSTRIGKHPPHLKYYVAYAAFASITEIIEPKTVREALESDNRENLINAIDTELNALKRNGT